MYINTFFKVPNGSPRPKSTKAIHFGVYHAGLASKPGGSCCSWDSVRCFWCHEASSFRLPPLSLVISQRPPPHSLNWRSWYWNKKMGVKPMSLCLGRAVILGAPLPSPGCCGAPDWSRSCPAAYRSGRAVPRPPPSGRWWPHPRLRRKLKSGEKKKKVI